MQRFVLAVVTLLLMVSATHADYLFMQYTMKFRRPAQGQGGPPTPVLPGQPTPPPQPGAGNQEDEIIQVPVNAVVELQSYKELGTMTACVKYATKHKWGSTSLYNDDDLQSRYVKLPTPKARYKGKVEALGKNRTNERIYDLVDWCITHALVDEAASHLDEVAKSGKKTGLDRLDRAVEAYTQVKAGLAQRIDREESSVYWRGRLGFRMEQSDHYSLLYNAPLSNPPEVQRRIKALEDNMRAIYYWFAIKGLALPMPTQKMVCVLLDQPDQFKLQRALIEDEPLSTDGFFAARDNVVVFSAQRLDDPAVLFGRQMQGLYQQGWDREALLKGQGVSTRAGKTIDERYRMETMALLDKAMEDEAERAAITHEATRQIFVSSGIQKNTVVMPDWLQFGMGSVFETPKGPFPFAPVEARVAYYPMYAGPSWAFARIFKLVEQGGLNTAGAAYLVNIPLFRLRNEFTTAGNALARVVTDSDFAVARDMGPTRGGQVRLIEARTYSWGLCFWLAKTRPQGLLRLYEELSKLPRDIEPEPNELLAAFCRSFDVADVTGAKMDPGKFENLAKDWLGFMQSVSTPGAEFGLGVTDTGGNNPGSGPGPKGGGKGGGNPKGP